jgi:hypothetical protein
LQETVALEDHSRRAEAALDCPVLHESFLQRMQLPVFSQALDSKHFLSRDILERVPAGSNGFSVDDHGACPAMALTATELGAGESHLCAQHPEERSFTIRRYANRTAVEPETNGLFHRLPSFRRGDDFIQKYGIRLRQNSRKWA